mmetsp:Transcript_1251/g.2383  ORF Transcript_1251/g.2383 Transcript_1251/m.2383 type:complete len:562 (-) Transcript_1251:920-2605(-)
MRCCGGLLAERVQRCLEVRGLRAEALHLRPQRVLNRTEVCLVHVVEQQQGGGARVHGLWFAAVPAHLGLPLLLHRGHDLKCLGALLHAVHARLHLVLPPLQHLHPRLQPPQHLPHLPHCNSAKCVVNRGLELAEGGVEHVGALAVLLEVAPQGVDAVLVLLLLLCAVFLLGAHAVGQHVQLLQLLHMRLLHPLQSPLKPRHRRAHLVERLRNAQHIAVLLLQLRIQAVQLHAVQLLAVLHLARQLLYLRLHARQLVCDDGAVLLEGELVLQGCHAVRQLHHVLLQLVPLLRRDHHRVGRHHGLHNCRRRRSHIASRSVRCTCLRRFELPLPHRLLPEPLFLEASVRLGDERILLVLLVGDLVLLHLPLGFIDAPPQLILVAAVHRMEAEHRLDRTRRRPQLNEQLPRVPHAHHCLEEARGTVGASLASGAEHGLVDHDDHADRLAQPVQQADHVQARSHFDGGDGGKLGASQALLAEPALHLFNHVAGHVRCAARDLIQECKLASLEEHFGEAELEVLLREVEGLEEAAAKVGRLQVGERRRHLRAVPVVEGVEWAAGGEA